MPAKEKVKLAAPIVTDKELERAREHLKDEAAKKRIRSSMVHLLEYNSQNKEFHKMPLQQKKIRLDSFAAQRLTQADSKTFTTKKATTQRDTRTHSFEWMTKKHMIDRWGVDKATNKIEHGRLDTQADQDTGITCEWDIEYKIWFNQGGTEFKDELKGERSLEEKGAGKELLDILDDMRKGMFDETDTTAASNTDVQASAVNAAEAPSTVIKKEPTEDNPNKKTFESLNADKRKVMRNVGDLIITFKKWFVDTKDRKWLGELHEDVRKTLLALGNAYKRLETVHSENITDEATTLAMAKKLGTLYENVNEIITWHAKLFPKTPKKKGDQLGDASGQSMKHCQVG